MSNNEYDGKFYIGREYDLSKGKLKSEPTLYDPDDLTTHGVVVGMTGSGKTGLCIDILEEAALNGIPAIVIDPKGDIANLLLHFPGLKPEDFEPWVDPDIARREGKSTTQSAAETAKLWKDGLAQWGIGSERIEKVRQAVEYSIYSPGSDAALQVSILASLNAPQIPWDENRELMREKIASTATALLGLVGVQGDPMRSKEHILLANIFEGAWKKGDDLDLAELIRQVQNPPFDKLGALEVEQFIPEGERFELATLLNSFLASPSFQAWTEGEELDPRHMLWTAEGKPRHSIFYLAHLNEQERMFFVTLLLSSIETWMRTQPGSSSLKALIYFDEVLGFLPPVKEPPSKGPLIRLLKQARAFGLGILLTTQNPVDLDYKALSNAGTWFIGRLQTAQDKARLLDGLESAAGQKGGFNRKQADKAISKLKKRVFLLHNVHASMPQIFHTRWAMAYLKGPITRVQLKALNLLAGISPRTSSEIPPAAKPSSAGLDDSGTTLTRQTVSSGIGEYFLPNNLTVAESLKRMSRVSSAVQTLGLVYQPVLIAQATARILDRKAEIDFDQQISVLVLEPDRRGVVRWKNHRHAAFNADLMDDAPLADARFSDLQAPLTVAKTLRELERDFLEYVYRDVELVLQVNETLGLIAQPETTKAELRAQIAEAAREAREDEIDNEREKYMKKMKALQKKLTREQRELGEDESEHSARKMEEMATHFENVLGIFGGSRSRRRISSSMTKRRLTAQAKADIEESRDAIGDFERDLAALEVEMEEEIDEIEARWADVAGEMDEQTFKPFKKNIHIDLFGVAWLPNWRLKVGDDVFDAPGFMLSEGT